MTVVDKKQYYFPQPDILNIFEMMQQGKLPEPVISFSNQETEIIQLICKGLSNQKIADQLFLSKRTIESHRSRIFEKVGVSNAAGLVAFAFSNGIIKKLA